MRTYLQSRSNETQKNLGLPCFACAYHLAASLDDVQCAQKFYASASLKAQGAPRTPLTLTSEGPLDVKDVVIHIMRGLHTTLRESLLALQDECKAQPRNTPFSPDTADNESRLMQPVLDADPDFALPLLLQERRWVVSSWSLNAGGKGVGKADPPPMRLKPRSLSASTVQGADIPCGAETFQTLFGGGGVVPREAATTASQLSSGGGDTIYPFRGTCTLSLAAKTRYVHCLDALVWALTAKSQSARVIALQEQLTTDTSSVPYDDLLFLMVPLNDPVLHGTAGLMIVRHELDAIAAECRLFLNEVVRTEGAPLVPRRAMDVIKDVGYYLFHLLDEPLKPTSHANYYDKTNSFLNCILSQRKGIPLTLTLVFIAICQRLGIQGVHPVGMPGHFICCYKPPAAKSMKNPSTEGVALREATTVCAQPASGNLSHIVLSFLFPFHRHHHV